MVCVYSFELQFPIKVIMLQVDMEDNIPDGQKNPSLWKESWEVYYLFINQDLFSVCFSFALVAKIGILLLDLLNS